MAHRKILSIGFTILGVAVLFLLIKLVAFNQQKGSFSVLQVDATPKAIVYVNDQQMGSTPYLNEMLSAGEYKVKVANWETKLKLIANTLTYVSRNQGPTEEQSSGQILMLEKLSSANGSELVIISTPDKAQILLDGLNKGSAPLIQHIDPGQHTIVVSFPGFGSQVVRAKSIAGYRLNAVVKLALTSVVASPSVNLLTATPSAQPLAKPYVIIKSTPTGFLRVRLEPLVTASESGQVKPGETYPLISQVSSWVEIKLNQTSGWVNDQYVEKVED